MKDAGYVREKTFAEQMQKRIMTAFGSVEELNKIVEDATQQREEAEKTIQTMREQDAEYRRMNKELSSAKVDLLSERAKLQSTIEELKKKLNASETKK